MKRLFAIAVLFQCFAANLQASDSTSPTLTFDGFGTLGATRSSEDQADFRNGFIQPEGAGYTHEWTAHVDSRLGLQMTADLTDKLTGIVQVVVEQEYDHHTEPSIEWAYLKYDFTQDFSARVGRTVLPIFLISDTRKVGYAIPWIRPPTEVYGLAPITSTNGIEAYYRTQFGDVTATVEVVYGQTDVRFPPNDLWKARDGVAAVVNFDFGDTVIHAGYQRADLDSESITTFFDVFRAFGPQGDVIAERYSVDSEPITLGTIGVSHDPGDWFVMGEWVRSSSDSFLGTNEGWYVSGGYRIGKFTPYLNVGGRQKQNIEESGINVGTLPPPLQGQAMALNDALSLILNSNDFSSTTVGVRWDISPGYGLKLQADRFDLATGSYGDLINIQPEFEPGGDFTVVSIAFDFVF